MSEKKTFKNPWRLVEDFGYEHPHWCVYPSGSSSASEGGAFSQNDWDMEVTFTKKEKPIQINSVVEDQLGNTGRVVAVQADKAWVHYYLNDSGRAVDFDCVEWLSELTDAI